VQGAQRPRQQDGLIQVDLVGEHGDHVQPDRRGVVQIVVDLPAPFGPRKPVTMPGWTTKSSPSTASFSPYRLLRFSTSIIACSLHRWRW
jgi:hypothetical protein